MSENYSFLVIKYPKKETANVAQAERVVQSTATQAK